MLGVGFFHADPHPGNIFAFPDGTLGLIDFGAVGRLDPIQQAAVVDILAALVRRDVSLLRDGIERVADLTETVSPDRLERALARLMADHLKPSGAVDPAVLQDLIALLTQFGVRLPGELVILSRALVTLDGTLRVLAPGLSLVTATSEIMLAQNGPAPSRPRRMLRDELLSALPQLRRLPDRIDRILTLTGRGDLRIRHLMDEDGKRTVRTLVNRALLAAVGAAFLVGRDAAARRAGGRSAGRERHRSLRGLRLRRAAPRHGSDAPRRRRRRSRWDDMTMISSSELQLGRHRPVPSTPTSRPPGERYFRHPGDVLRLLLWGAVTAVLAIFISVTTSSSKGLTADLGRAAGRVPDSLRELVLAVTQVGTIAVAGARADRARRRSSAGGGSACSSSPAPRARPRSRCSTSCSISIRALRGAVTSGTWVASTQFPSLAYVAGAAAATTGCKPWLPRSWRRAADIGLLVLVLAMAFAGSAGVPELVLALAAGATVGAGLLVGFGSPNRRPAPSAVALALGEAGLDLRALSLARAEGGRAQLYRADTGDGGSFVKVYAQDSRDADLLYRGYRALLLRGPNDDYPSLSLEHDVEHEALMLLMAGQAGVSTPAVRAVTELEDGSMVLAMERVDGRLLDELDASEIDAALLDAIWEEVALLHRARFAHRVLRAGNIMVADRRPRLIDMDFAEGVRVAAAPGDRSGRTSGVTGRDRRDRACRRVGRTRARARGPRRGRAVPAASRALGRDAQAGIEGDARRIARTDRRGHRRRTAALGAPDPSPAAHADDDHGRRRRVLPAASATRRRR